MLARVLTNVIAPGSHVHRTSFRGVYFLPFRFVVIGLLRFSETSYFCASSSSIALVGTSNGCFKFLQVNLYYSIELIASNKTRTPLSFRVWIAPSYKCLHLLCYRLRDSDTDFV